ncbi:MAG: ChuX/HutX family heme-like substrate-binding protein [Bacteroidota bacterium]
MENVINPLAAQWAALKEEQPGLRIRNAAKALDVTEVQLLATRCGDGVKRLKPPFQEILKEIESLGKVMALTRNEEVVHERKGVYLNPSLEHAHVGLFVGEDIDLRIFFQSWASAFAVEEAFKGKVRRSLQFFAKDGYAIHKIYLTPHSDVAAFEVLVAKYLHEDQSPIQEGIEPVKEKEAEKPDAEIDVATFQEGWRKLEDTHQFFGLVKKHKLSRSQALRLAPEGNYAVPVKPQALRDIITKASEKQVPIMVFVGNQGMIQIHSGPVKKLLDYQQWFNIMDPDFNLHVNEPAITQTWVVRKPTEDGTVTALECFNEKGDQVVQFFGKRKPGIPELEGWREIVAEVEAELRLH